MSFTELGEREQDDERDKERKRLNDKFKKTAATRSVKKYDVQSKALESTTTH